MAAPIRVRIGELEFKSLSQLHKEIEKRLNEAGFLCLSKHNFNNHIKKFRIESLCSKRQICLSLSYNELIHVAKADVQDEKGSYYFVLFDKKIYVGITTLFVHERLKKHLYDSKKSGKKCAFHQAINRYFGEEVTLDSFLCEVDMFVFTSEIPCDSLVEIEAALIELYSKEKGYTVLNSAKPGSLHGRVGRKLANSKDCLASLMRKKIKTLKLSDFKSAKTLEALRQRFYSMCRKIDKDLQDQEKIRLINRLVEELRQFGRFIPVDCDSFIFKGKRQPIYKIANQLKMNKHQLKSYLVRREIFSSSEQDVWDVLNHPENNRLPKVKHNFYQVLEYLIREKGVQDKVVKNLLDYQKDVVTPTLAGFIKFLGYASKRNTVYYHLKKRHIDEASNSIHKFFIKCLYL